MTSLEGELLPYLLVDKGGCRDQHGSYGHPCEDSHGDPLVAGRSCTHLFTLVIIAAVFIAFSSLQRFKIFGAAVTM
jgi:hypothetical protein